MLRLGALALGVLFGGCRWWAAGPRGGRPSPSRRRSRRAEVRLSYIDEMIKEAWDEASVKPSRLATDEEFLRRAYLDVLGRIPEHPGGARRSSSSKEKGKRAKLVEYLLNHPDYAKNFANQWTVLLIGRKRQERQVDRERADGLAPPPVHRQPALERDRLRPDHGQGDRTRRTARSTSRWPTWRSAPCR